MENTQKNHGVNHPQQYEEFVDDSPNIHTPDDGPIPDYPTNLNDEEETEDENDQDTYEIDPDYEVDDDEEGDSEDDPANGLVYDDNDLEYDDLDEEEEGEHEGRG